MAVNKLYLNEDDRTVFGSSTGGHVIYDSDTGEVDVEEIEYPIEKTWDELTDAQKDQAVEYEQNHFDWDLWNDLMLDDFGFLLEQLKEEYGIEMEPKDFPFDDRYGGPNPQYDLSMFDDTFYQLIPEQYRRFLRNTDAETELSADVEFSGRYSHEADEATYDFDEVVQEAMNVIDDLELPEDSEPSVDELKEAYDIASARLKRKCKEYVHRVEEYMEKVEEFQGKWCDGPDEDYIRSDLESRECTFLIDEDGDLDSIEY